jgi:hypothetical protein
MLPEIHGSSTAVQYSPLAFPTPMRSRQPQLPSFTTGYREDQYRRAKARPYALLRVKRHAFWRGALAAWLGVFITVVIIRMIILFT